MNLRVLTLSTLFPDMTRPNFGIFVERQVRELASRDGMDVTVISPVGLPPWPLYHHPHYAALLHVPAHEEWKSLSIHRPRFTVIPGTGARFHVRAMTRAILPLVRRLHAEQPFDVIDASFFFPDGPVARNISSTFDIPYSIKARGADIHHWGRHPATRADILAAGNDADGLLAVSAAMQRSMVTLGMDADKIRVHYTGVDLDRFTPQDRAVAREAYHFSGPVVLCLGALIPRKGQDLLIRALPALPDVTLVLAGQGSERTAYETLARELGVDDRVSLLGSIPHATLPHLINAADVMALPSASEGLANAWVESLACGTPVVTTDVGGARELIDRPAAGAIVERTPEALAAAIRAILDDPPDRQAVRETALRFTWQANGDALVEHLRSIARHNSSDVPA